MTPQEVMVEFQTSRHAPLAAMQSALDAKEEMLPAFISELERATHTHWEDLPYAGSYAIMFEILGEWGDPRSYLPLARFLRLDEETLDGLLGEGTTESADRVMAAVAADDLTPVFDIILDKDAALYLRSAMITALLRLAIERPGQRVAVAGFIEEFRSRVEANVDPYLSCCWAEAVAVLGLNHLDAKARAAIAEYTDLFPPYTIGEFESDLKESEKDPSGFWFLREHLRPGAIDAIGEVSHWHCYSEKYIRQIEQEETNVKYQRPFPWQEPDIAINPYRAIGRNDPCPCGSGKKYKKCCLN